MTRLIDADVLIHRLKTAIDLGKKIDGIVGELEAVLNDVESMPTVDAVPVSELHGVEKERDYWMDMAHSYEQTILRLTISAGEVPVRHGKWIDIDEQTYTWKVRCSCCGNERSMMSTQGKCPNYCEACGARMDDGNRNE